MVSKKEKADKDSRAATARTRLELAIEAWSEIRKEAKIDVEFRAGDQWPDNIRAERDADDRPCLTVNRIPQFVRQVTNDQRQNRPSIKVNAVDDNADKDIAKILQGIIRHIEKDSRADVAYDTAFEGAVTKGFGFFRITADYCDSNSFDQELKIKKIKDDFSVYIDPYFTEPDGSDMNWAFVTETYNRDDYLAQFPDTDLAKMTDWGGLTDGTENWVGKDSCRVTEYYEKEFIQVKIYLLSDGSTVEKKDLPENIRTKEEAEADPYEDELYIVKERETTRVKVKHSLFNGFEFWDETEWLSQWIPLIPVFGDELWIDGKRVLEGIVRHARDSQRMYNFWVSAETEAIALAPKAPYIGAEGQFEGHEDQWDSSNRRNLAFLQYKPKTLANGQPAPPPQRNAFEAPVGAITNARMQSSEDMKATTGIYDASLGNRSNENSGIAIQRRNHQAQTNNFHYVDNLTRSLNHSGRILIELIPKIYDTPRAIRIIGENDQAEIQLINQLVMKDGEPKDLKLNHGKYDVSVSTGPSYATKRQETVDQLLQLIQSYPRLAELSGDILVKNMDVEGADEISERLKKTLPPGILEEMGDDKAKVPPEIQAQLQQMTQVIEQMTGQLNQAQDKIERKTLELESKERIEMLKAETDLRIALLKEDSADSRESFRAEINQLDQKQKVLSARTVAQESMAPTNFNPTGGPTPGEFMEN